MEVDESCKVNTSALRVTSWLRAGTWPLRWGHCICHHHPSCTAVDGLEVWPATQGPCILDQLESTFKSQLLHVFAKICPLCLRCLYDLRFWSLRPCPRYCTESRADVSNELQIPQGAFFGAPQRPGQECQEKSDHMSNWDDFRAVHHMFHRSARAAAVTQ